MSKANTRVIDLPSKQNPTGNEQVYIATENSDEKISLNEMREFFGQEFSRKAENLADIDALQARNNLSVYSKTEVDTKNGVQDENIRSVEQKNTEQGEKISTLESTIEQHTESLEALQEKNTETDTKITEIEIKNEQQDAKILSVEEKNTEQDNRLDAIEQRNTKQDTEVEKKIGKTEANKKFALKNHTHTTTEITDFTEKTVEILRENIMAGQNVTITQEGGKIKITASGGGSDGNSGGDMLKSIYDTNNNGKVDTAENAENLGGREAGEYALKTEIPEAYTPPANLLTADNLNAQARTLSGLTVTPGNGAGSASIFLEYPQVKKYEFFTDANGAFGVWNKTNENDVFRIDDRNTTFYRTPNFRGMKLTSVGNPTNESDGTNKRYVDTAITTATGTLETKVDAMSKKEALEESITQGLETKVDKVEGKMLTSNDFSDEYKAKIDNMTAGFQNVSDVKKTNSGFSLEADGKKYTIYSSNNGIFIAVTEVGGYHYVDAYELSYTNGILRAIEKVDAGRLREPNEFLSIMRKYMKFRF